MPGYCLKLAYDGYAYAGWQAQRDRSSIQGTLLDALKRIDTSIAQVFGASRTDAGVHAQGQVAAFQSKHQLEAHTWIGAINRYLPQDIRVTEVWPCADHYNPRFDTHSKRYRYLIDTAPTACPYLHRYAWFLGAQRRQQRQPHHQGASPELDLDAMQNAARYLEGTHDFAAFQAGDDYRQNSVRTLLSVKLEQSQLMNLRTLLQIDVEGTAFLKHMVRILVGTLIEVGRHQRSAESIETLLHPNARREEAGITAPAHGLHLLNITLKNNR